MITSIIDDISIIDELENLLEYESLIEFKKKNKIQLSKEEYFFDTYVVKPSLVIGILLKEFKRKE